MYLYFYPNMYLHLYFIMIYRSLSIYESLLGKDSPEAAVTMNNLVRIYSTFVIYIILYQLCINFSVFLFLWLLLSLLFYLFKLWELLLQLCMLFWILPTVIIFFFLFIILAVPTTSVMISIPIFIFTYNSISSSILIFNSIFNSIFISISTSILTHTTIPFLPHVHIIEIR